MEFLQDPIVAGVISTVIATIIITQWQAAKRWFMERPWAVGGLAGFIAALFSVGVFRPNPVPLNPLPEGVVVASIQQCARLDGGWVEFEDGQGRMIVGVGSTRDARGETQAFSRDEPTGGSFEHELSEPEMPIHNHNNGGYSELLKVTGERTPGHGPDRKNLYPEEPDIFASKQLQESGQSQPHNNMPPYIALYFCKKEG